MGYLLALETSSTICSVALYQQDQLLGVTELRIEKSHSSHITVLIAQLLQNCQVQLNNLSAVALSGGPGSYTGLRIGSATAKGICFALNIPLIEVSTLAAIAAAAISTTPDPGSFLFCPMVDARRQEVYTCLFDQYLGLINPVSPLILNQDSFAKDLKDNKIIFCGNGAGKFKALLTNHSNALFLENIMPSAVMVGKLAGPKWEQKIFQNVAYYEPFYLKEVYITSSVK